MPTLNQYIANGTSVENYRLDKYRIDKFRADGMAYEDGGQIDSYVKSMLHFNGVDNGTTFTDETGKLWTSHSAVTKTATKKFGTASGYFDGGRWIETPDNEDFNVGNEDFTFDFWLQRSNTSDYLCYVFGQGDSSLTDASKSIFAFLDTNSSSIVVTLRYNATERYCTSNGAVKDTNWHHVAIVRSGNFLNIYLDGNNSGSFNISGITINNSSSKFVIGKPGEFMPEGSFYFQGYLDEFRFSKGIGRWTANFVPPNAEYHT